MPGEIKKIIDKIIVQRSKGNNTIAMTTRAKITLKGISVDTYTLSSPDEPETIKKLKAIATEMGVTL